MGVDVMLQWFKLVILPIVKAKKKRGLLLIDSFSVHETEEFLHVELAHANNADVSILVVVPPRFSFYVCV